MTSFRDTVFSKFILVVARVRALFLFTEEQYPTVCTCDILVIESSAGGHLSCFPSLVIMNNAALNIREQGLCFQFSWVYTWESNCWVAS